MTTNLFIDSALPLTSLPPFQFPGELPRGRQGRGYAGVSPQRGAPHCATPSGCRPYPRHLPLSEEG